jgi:hypothetical protein
MPSAKRIRTMPAIILTAVTALEVIGRGEDRVAMIIGVEVR